MSSYIRCPYCGEDGLDVDTLVCGCDEERAAKQKRKDEIATLTAQLAAMTAEREELCRVLSFHGFRRCDTPACNCGSWHWHYVEGDDADRKLDGVLKEMGGLEGQVVSVASARLAQEAAALAERERAAAVWRLVRDCSLETIRQHLDEFFQVLEMGSLTACPDCCASDLSKRIRGSGV